MIPVIDISPLFSSNNDEIKKVATKLYQVYSTIGFAQLINHQIPDKVIKDIFVASKYFHEKLLQSEKNKIRFQQYLKGYLPINSSTLKQSELGEAKTPNQSESFFISTELDSSDKFFNGPLGGKNIWPLQPFNFKKLLMNYYDELSVLSNILIKTFAIGLNFPDYFLNQYFSNPNIMLRLLRYQPTISASDKELYGSAPHTDYGCITLLLQDNVGGLQVKSKEGIWIDVNPIENAFVLNIGQMMAIWSNGMLKATPHRVINKSNSKTRYSVAYFYNCNLDTMVEPLAQFISADNPKQCDPIIYGEHLEDILLKNYAFTGRKTN